MKRKSFILSLLLVFTVLLTACSQITATDYKDLSKNEQQKINIKLSLHQEKNVRMPDPMYSVNMKITNNSDKKVSFDESKFSYVIGEKANKPSQSEKITVKPKESKTIKNLFEKVGEQDTVGGAVVNYQHSEIASADFSNSSEYASNNSDDSSSYEDNESHHNSKEEAMRILEDNKDKYGFTEPVESMQAKELQHSWVFTTSMNGETTRFMVSDNGQIRVLYGNF